MSNDTQLIVFKNLYDDVWAAFAKAPHKWSNDRIIMPQNFKPEIGKQYECRIQHTRNGTYVWNNQTYDLCFAELTDAANVIDVIKHQLRQNTPLNTLAEKLKGLDLSELPEKHEIVTLEVQEDQKNGGLMFKPQYEDQDPYAGGQTSMRFFHAINNGHLDPKKTYHGKIKQAMLTPRETIRGAKIVQVRVELI
ncbi:MAG: hypothetical protein GF365_05680 [Candidatus Buchananbacteria bacterium]|nr:hypothetical protein [Candidatus Buchananbacteria bacterium]